MECTDCTVGRFVRQTVRTGPGGEIVPAALAASCAFMMPVATPPNAIVYGSGKITIPQMAKAGLVMNILGIILLSLVALFLAPAVLF